MTCTSGAGVLRFGWLSKKFRNMEPRNAILGFLFATAVYAIWMERNNRRFNSRKRENSRF